MSLLLSLLFTIIGYVHSQTDSATATFGSGSDAVIGTVVIQDGMVTIDIDVTNGVMNNPSVFSPTCLDSGLQYHIHEMWENLPSSWAINSANCGATNTGGHFDPYLACGSATGSTTLCANKNGCVATTYDCSPSTFSLNPLACEIGDLSGKYGTLTRDNTSDANYTFSGVFESFYEISAADLDGMSIVFHCADTGNRTACASFSVDLFGDEIKPSQSDLKTVVVDFSNAVSMTKKYNSDTSNELIMQYDGSWSLELNISPKNKLSNNYDMCSYYIFSEWNSIYNSEWGNDACSFATGGSTWDPTASCLPYSSNSACQGDSTCGTSTYSCSDSVPYSCSPSDLSGRWGNLYANNFSALAISGTDYYMPSLANIAGLSVGIVCSDEILLCGKIQDVSQAIADATFPTNNPYTSITGFVSVENQYIEIDLDLSAESQVTSACSDGGLAWHIHEMWNYDDDLPRLGSTACGATYTGGHYDPYGACGSATGNQYCEVLDSGLCDASGAYINSSTWDADANGEYTCSATVFPTLPFACEVGDWSGKYGKVLVSSGLISGTFETQYAEVKASELEGKSIVFHCNNAVRIFCAPFIVSGSDGDDYAPTIVSSILEKNLDTYVAYFDKIFDTDKEENYIKFYSNSKYEIVINADISSECSTSSSYRISLYNDWDKGSGKQLAGSDCTSNMGTFFDPGYSCPPQVDNDQCTCKAANNYTYSCDYNAEKFSCSVGDISGKFGMITPGEGFYMTGYDFTLPPISDLQGLSAVIECGSSDNFAPIGCTGFSEIKSAASNLFTHTFIFALFTSFMVIIVC